MDNPRMKHMTYLKTVCTWDNGMVIVFDSEGQQVPECQDTISKVREPIWRRCTESTAFRIGSYRNGTQEVSPEVWYAYRPRELALEPNL